MDEFDEGRNARSRSPMRVPAPVVQEERASCGLCGEIPLTPQHHSDWNLWLTFGQDRHAVVGATKNLGMFVHWPSVHYSTMGASVPICDECRRFYYRHLTNIARVESQHDYKEFNPPLNQLGSVAWETWQAYRIVTKLLARQIYLKMVEIERALNPIAD